MNLLDFYTEVDSIIGEGGAANSVIISASRLAMNKLERTYPFRYMMENKIVALPVGDAGADQLDLGVGVKTILSGEVRPVGGGVLSGEMFVKLTQDPHVKLDSERFENLWPFWLKSNRYVFSLLPTTTAKDVSFLLLRYTQDWPAPTATSGQLSAYSDHLLTNQLEDLFLAEVVLTLVPATRDPDLRAMYQGIRDEGIKSLYAEGFLFSVDDFT